jgi:signal recognition particle subunit SRP54
MFDSLSSAFTSLFSSLGSTSIVTEKTIADVYQSVRNTLIDADVPLDVVDPFLLEIKKEVVGRKVIGSLRPAEQFTKVVYDTLVSFLGGSSGGSDFSFSIPSTVMVMGLQGAGKTTTIAKLAHYVRDSAVRRNKQRSILLASVDFYRPAAIEQLKILAKNIQVDFYESALTDPLKASIDIQEYAKKHCYDVLFLDTAGRLHIDQSMLDELIKIDKAIKPKYKILVIDAMVGQESLAVARAFDVLNYQGAIITKFDSDSRSGVAFAFRYACKKPILFLGSGERPTDLELFRPERIATRIIGMGDVATLVEQAQDKIAQKEQDDIQKTISSGRLTFEDFIKQMDMMNRLGSLSTLVRFLPGASSLNLTPEIISKGEVESRKARALIQSMTLKERKMSKLAEVSRKQRIAIGSGLSLSDVDDFLKRFEQSQQFVKIFKKMGHFGGI